VDGAAPLTVNLAEIDRGAVALVGGKGANLGDLARAGFPVPKGFVLTTRAYALAAEAAGVDPARPPEAAERLRAAPLPDAIANAARKAYAALESGRVAVRSSATAEDLPGARSPTGMPTLSTTQRSALPWSCKRWWMHPQRACSSPPTP